MDLIEQEAGRHYIRTYRSPYEACLVAEQVDRSDGERLYASQEKGGGSWYGTESFEEAVSFGKFGGWNPTHEFGVLTRVDNALGKLQRWNTYQPYRAVDVQGDQVDMGRYMAGEPEHMWGWVPEEQLTTQRVFTVVLNVSAACGWTAEEMMLKGEIVLGLVNAIRGMGFDLNVWVEDSSVTISDGESITVTYLTALQTAGETVDGESMVFPLCNPDWLRRIVFGLIEADQGPGKWFEFGYGAAIESAVTDVLGVDLTFELGREWDGGADDPVENALLFVEEQLRELGMVPDDVPDGGVFDIVR